MKTLSTLLVLCAAVWFAPSASAQNSNTIVRFHFYRGATVIGDVDVEMFDQDKPVTVSNFLRYVRSGAYHNLLLNRCYLRSDLRVIQAGALWTPSPLSASVFGAGTTANYGPITNEFSVGPRLSNTFGTIAMARIGGDTNSASAEWFFNLADNSTLLDNVDGGFTVFGRVIAGTNALDFFNHPSAASKLSILQFPSAYFADFPVGNASHNCGATGCPRYNELYHIKISELPITDTKPPTVAITSPAPNARFTNSPITVTGTAADDQGVSSIYYAIGGSSYANAPGGTTWSITSDISAGTNLIYVSSVDAAGQRSALATRSVFYSVLEPLNLTHIGSGSVVGATNGRRFEVGRFVTLTAKPAAGNLFAGWSGSFTYSPAKVEFLMFSNASLTATFVTNPFAPLKGTYSGLFFNPNVTYHPHGAITFSVTDQGKVSGKLNVVGRSVPFSGVLSAYGEANIRVSAPSVAPLFGVPSDWFIRFVLDTTNKTDQIFGPTTDNPGYPYVWNPDPAGGFGSEMRVHRVRPGTTAAPSPFAGKYTFAIPGSANPARLAAGDLFNVSNLVVTLRDHSDAVSQYLWVQFSPDIRSVLTNSLSTLSEQQSNLVAALNQILEGGSIYEPMRFAGVPLTAEIHALRALNPTGADLIRLNRLLLQAAYPASIAFLPPLHPEGDGYGAVTISAAGAAKVVGTLADGTAFTAAGPVATNGLWPLYTGLYGVRGWLFGWITYELSNPADDLHGAMRWRKAGPFPGKPYPNGFEVSAPLGGSRYATATATHRVLDFTNGVVALIGPNLAAPSMNDVFLATNNTVLNLDTNKLTFAIVKPTGLFNATVKPVGETRTIPFKGALLPKQNYGAGFYLSTNLSGRVYFGE